MRRGKLEFSQLRDMLKDVNSGVEVSDEVVRDVMERFGNKARDNLLHRVKSGGGGVVLLSGGQEDEDGVSRFQTVHVISYFYTHGYGLGAEGEAVAAEGRGGGRAKTEGEEVQSGVKSACCAVS